MSPSQRVRGRRDPSVRLFGSQRVRLLPAGSGDRIDRRRDTTPVFHGNSVGQHIAELIADVVRGPIAELGEDHARTDPDVTFGHRDSVTQ